MLRLENEWNENPGCYSHLPVQDRAPARGRDRRGSSLLRLPSTGPASHVAVAPVTHATINNGSFTCWRLINGHWKAERARLPPAIKMQTTQAQRRLTSLTALHCSCKRIILPRRGAYWMNNYKMLSLWVLKVCGPHLGTMLKQNTWYFFV